MSAMGGTTVNLGPSCLHASTSRTGATAVTGGFGRPRLSGAETSGELLPPGAAYGVRSGPFAASQHTPSGF